MDNVFGVRTYDYTQDSVDWTFLMEKRETRLLPFWRFFLQRSLSLSLYISFLRVIRDYIVYSDKTL